MLYVHGSTFPIALSIGYRFDGVSWADSLSAAGFDVWGLDFAGHGRSRGRPWFDAADQIFDAVDYIIKTTGYEKILILAHSWGSLPAGAFACLYPRRLKALALFGPIARRDGPAVPELREDLLISVQDQYVRFTADVPAGETAVLSQAHFAAWATDWLNSDAESSMRSPPAVRVPSAPYNDISAAWSGRPAYDPAGLSRPTLVVRGEWDSVCSHEDMHRIGNQLDARYFHHATVPRGTHLLHLESGRQHLYAACETFFRQQLKDVP